MYRLKYVMVDLLILLSAIGGLGGFATVISLAYWLGRKFEEINGEFKSVRSEAEKRSGELRGEMDKRISELREEMSERFSVMEERLERLSSRIERLGFAFTGYQEFFVEFLVSEGVISRDKGGLVKEEVKKLVSMALINPLKREEWIRIRDLVDRDDLTLEEALELRDLARKAIKEYGDKPEVYKLHIYSCIMVGLARRKSMEVKTNSLSRN